MTSTTQPDLRTTGSDTGIPTHEELIERARALRPFLIERQEETELNTFPTEEVQQAFIDNGFYKVLTPKRYGGYQMNAWSFLRLAIELARANPSAAWCYTLGHSHAYSAAAFFSPEAQEELFSAPDGYFVAASFAFPRGEARRVDGGYVINGVYPYGSGSPYSNHYMGVVPAPAGSPHGPEGSHLSFVAKREDFTVGDDWGNILGMRGSGSGTVTIKDAFVPDHWILPNSYTALGAVDGSTPGSLYHGDSTYAMPQLAFASTYPPALVIGMGFGALDAYEEVIKKKAPERIPGITDPAILNAKVKAEVSEYQRAFGLASMEIEAGEALMKSVCDELAEMGAEGSVDPERNLKLTCRTGYSGRLVWNAVNEHLWRTGGSSQALNSARMQRYFRDIATWYTAPGNGHRDSVAQMYGQTRLFGPPAPPEA
ncbi:MAG TPA: acyl-CoA dehydrogenase family protein [Streptomyces sp.]|uniref:acyl-CoA dehydrogenase family protein n=1 Tax=Streptomyces sp. TaxID=1931 RepID=UPI002B6DBD70|nr:acyl-CoA dehydrogenase family protein [Streptomyces sp.]HWU09293.1 acyl-CoA dehydrogenase family protein [Streptomyces sp.]